MTVRVRWLSLALAAVVAACSGGQVTSTASPTAQAAAPTTAAEPSPTSSATLAPTASPSPSALAGCMDKATFDLLMKNMSKLDELSQAQRDTIVAALQAYDFGSDAAGVTWRDDMVEAIKKGDFDTVGLGAMGIVSGTIKLKACA